MATIFYFFTGSCLLWPSPPSVFSGDGIYPSPSSSRLMADSIRCFSVLFCQDVPKRNKIRFTSVQVEAIRSGMNPGLTMVVGPPGTGASALFFIHSEDQTFHFGIVQRLRSWNCRFGHLHAFVLYYVLCLQLTSLHCLRFFMLNIFCGSFFCFFSYFR